MKKTVRNISPLVKSRQQHARLRTKKVTGARMAVVMRLFAVSVVIIFVLGSVFAVFGMVAYSLKNGGKISIPDQVATYLQKTPLSFLVKVKSTNDQKKMVVGLSQIVEYPKSEFMFSTFVKSDSFGGFTLVQGAGTVDQLDGIYKFLSTGQSVYRLPLNTQWSGVQHYYDVELQSQGWKKELSVGLTDLEKMPGEYYTKDEKGLHIYQVSFDIWYESITKVQAEQGLNDKIVAYKAKQELVQAASGRDLPADAGWQLRYSRDWELEMQNNSTYNAMNLFFTNSKSKERVIFSVLKKYPKNIADLDYAYLESVGTDHIVSWLTTQPISVTFQSFTKSEIIIAEGKALLFSNLNQHASFVFLTNRKNGLVYVIQYVGRENPEFLEYIKSNLKNN
jgi:hypothetical protein